MKLVLFHIDVFDLNHFGEFPIRWHNLRVLELRFVALFFLPIGKLIKSTVAAAHHPSEGIPEGFRFARAKHQSEMVS